MRLKEDTYQRLKKNSRDYSGADTYNEIIIKILDFYEKNKNIDNGNSSNTSVKCSYDDNDGIIVIRM